MESQAPLALRAAFILTLALASWLAATASATPAPQSTTAPGPGSQGDVLTGARPIGDLVRPSDALRAFLEHRAVGAPGAVAVVVDAGSAAAVVRARAAIEDLRGAAAKGPFIFATFYRTGLSEPRVLATWTQLQQAVSAVTVAPPGAAESRANGPGPLDAVLGVAGASPRGTRIILVTEDGAKGVDREAATVAGVARALQRGGFELDAWTLGSCSDYAAVESISRATGGTLGCGDLAVAAVAQDQGSAGTPQPVRRAADDTPCSTGAAAPLEVRVGSSVHRHAGLDAEVQGRGAAGRATLRSSSPCGKVHEPRGVAVGSVQPLGGSGRPLGSAAQAGSAEVYNSTRQVARREAPPGAPGQAEFTGEESEWEVQKVPGKPLLVETTGHNGKGEVLTRVSNLTRADNVVIVLPPVDVVLNPNSQLITRPGQTLQLSYDVTNNLDIPQALVFYMRDKLAFLRQLRPYSNLVPPRQTLQVVATLVIGQNAQIGQMDQVDFYAKSQTTNVETRKGAIVYVQQEQSNDIWNPSVWGTWKSTCSGAWDPATCATNTWTIDFEIQDRDSGLLSVISYPRGVQFRNDFVSGTREKVNAYYSASCCAKRVDIMATDLRGNTNRQTFDVGSQFLNPGEIAGISVGVIAIILIVIIIVLAILLCRRRESLRLERRLSSRLAAREGR